MRWLRPIIFALLIAGAFYYFTTHGRGRITAANWIANPSKVEITEAAGPEGVDPEEQNNISVYRKNIPAGGDHTSRAPNLCFFFRGKPQEGPGSRFRIYKEGHN